MTKEEMVSHVELSLYRARTGITKLPPEVLALPGMSSHCNRICLNELMSAPGYRYLEVGCWKGATAISALYDNPFGQAVLLDNFSEFNVPSPEPELRANLDRFCPHFQGDVFFRNEDCFSAHLTDSYDVFFYDGNHTVESQRRAFVHFDHALAPTFIAVVDDWNWKDVRDGTFRAFQELEYDVLRQWDIFTPDNNSEGWHNGFLVALVRH